MCIEFWSLPDEPRNLQTTKVWKSNHHQTQTHSSKPACVTKKTKNLIFPSKRKFETTSVQCVR
jgi:hypothetical protein